MSVILLQRRCLAPLADIRVILTLVDAIVKIRIGCQIGTHQRKLCARVVRIGAVGLFRLVRQPVVVAIGKRRVRSLTGPREGRASKAVGSACRSALVRGS